MPGAAATRTALLPLIAALLALGVISCGGDDGSGTDAGKAGTESAEIPGGADPDAVAVIDEWSSALREGDVEAAADHFALPSIAQNGTPALELDTRAAVIAFNEALPCGAVLVEAVERGRFVVASFELTERPGGGCGDGAGAPAKTAFVISDGEIVEWRRAADEPPPPPPDTPVT